MAALSGAYFFVANIISYSFVLAGNSEADCFFRANIYTFQARDTLCMALLKFQYDLCTGWYNNK